MKILFFGGTNFFGEKILRGLIRNDHDVTFITRGNSTPKNIMARHICGDRNDPVVLQKAKESGPYDAIIDNIAYKPEDALTALSVLDAKHYILTSTIAVDYPYRPLGVAPANLPSLYAINKKAVEEVVRHQTRIPWTILRPGIVYGPSDPMKRSLWYIQKLLSREIIPIASSNRLLSFVYEEDLFHAYQEALFLSESQKYKIYTLTQDEYLTVEQFVLEHAHVLEVSPNFRRIPVTEIKDQGGPFCYEFEFIGGRPYTLTQWRATPWKDAVKRSAPCFKKQYEDLASHP